MFVINGIDYAFHIFATTFIVASVAVFFTVQYILCKKSKRMAIKLIPAYGVLILIILAFLVTISSTGGSFIDLRSFIALVILGYALICGISAGVAWVIYRIIKRKCQQNDL
jgi:hypothetical protein